MDYFKRNPNALPALLGALIFIGLLIFAGVNQGTFKGKETAPVTAATAKVG
jgi:hypothetical protein